MSEEHRERTSAPEEPEGAPAADPPPPPGRTGVGVPRPRGGVRGRATRRRLTDRPCLNCGDPTPGEYCRTCGQRKVEVLVSIRAMVKQLLEDEFIIDRRLPRTLVGLLFRPGFLTLEHIHGRIARYVRPFRLYLASSILFFLLISFLSLRAIARADFGEGVAPQTATADTADVAAMDSALAEIRQRLTDTTLSAPARAGLELGRRTLEERRARLASRDTAAAQTPPATRTAAAGERPRTVAELLERDPETVVRVRTGFEALDSALVRRVRDLGDMTPRQAAERLVGDFLSYIPTMMFVLLPVFALVLKLLYLRRRRYYVEHFVFLLHVHAFVYLIFTTLLAIRGVLSLPGWLVALLLGWTAAYIYIAMKRVYGQGWLKTLAKYWILGWSYVVILVFSIPLGFAISMLVVP